MTEIEPLILRAGGEGDLPIVKDAWATTFNPKGSIKGPMGDRWVTVGRSWLAPSVTMAAHRVAIDHLLQTGHLLVGHVAEAPEIVLCFAAFEHSTEATTVHYVWTRKALRRRGYGLALMRTVAALGRPTLRYSHMTTEGLALAKHHENTHGPPRHR